MADNLHSNWDKYIEQVIVPNEHKDVAEARKNAFYAGAFVARNLIVKGCIEKVDEDIVYHFEKMKEKAQIENQIEVIENKIILPN